MRPVRARPNSTGPAVWQPAATPRGPPRPGPSAVGKAGRTRWAGWINSHEFLLGDFHGISIGISLIFPWDYGGISRRMYIHVLIFWGVLT